MTRLLQAQGIQEPVSSEDGVTTATASPASTSQGGNVTKKRRFENSSSSSPDDRIPDNDRDGIPKDKHSSDPFKLDQTLSRGEQELVLQRYLKEIVPIFPLVPLPGDTSLDSLKRQRPILLQAVIYAGSTGILSLEKQEDVARALLNHLSSSIFNDVEKTLELVQAIQLTCLWYRSPRHHKHIAIYQVGDIAELKLERVLTDRVSACS